MGTVAWVGDSVTEKAETGACLGLTSQLDLSTRPAAPGETTHLVSPEE